MSTILIANPTLQHRELHIRLGERSPRILRIRALGQERFPDDLDGAQLASVRKQLEAAGAVPSGDPKAIRSRFSLIYTVGESPKPITTKEIDKAVEQDKEVRQELSGDVLERAAGAAFNESAKVGGREVSFELTQVNDQSPVRGGVDTEIVVSSKRRVSGRRETTRKS